ncbi:MAG: T9SS type A sorting domain-containing protein [Bacteroidales bacterium]|nr:T9SS type A sorting domain-containing protein [Bacteroidales bacterium]
MTSGLASAQTNAGNNTTEEGEVKEIKIIKPEDKDANTKIFPVPVINNRFTITSDKEFIFVRLTNIIGQETTREKFSNPRKRAEISFSEVQKGIYLVIIQYEDKTRTVKKILID